jgi:uncharacterized membrane protein
MATFSTEEALQFGSSTFSKRPWLFIGFTCVIFLISLAGSFISSFFSAQTIPSQTLSLIIGLGVSMYCGLVQTQFYLRCHNALDTVVMRSAFTTKKILLFASTYLLTMVAVMIGFVLLIIPGIVFAARSLFAPYIVLEKDCTPIEAIKESFRITKGMTLKMIFFVFILFVINVVGLFALCVGLLVTIPISALATVHVYRKLSEVL